MNFGKTFDRKKDDNSSKNLEEMYKIKREIEKEDEIFEKELPAKYILLQKFNMTDLKTLCSELLGSEPSVDEYDDPKSENKKILPQYKEDYIHFIIDELRLSEIKNYAIKNKIISVEL
jgi:predicted RND superfamily exporter protein